MKTYAIPREIVVNPAEKLLYVTPELDEAFPEITEAFAEVDRTFESLPYGYLRELEKSQFSFHLSTGATIDYSLIPGKGRELLVMWAPFSDSAPNSTGQMMYDFIEGSEQTRPSPNKAKPHSWNQTTKSAVAAELLKAVGCEMPVLTIFQPLPSFPHNAFYHAEYKQIRKGNFTPSAYLAKEAIRHAQDRLHGPMSETQIDSFHTHGAALGASMAVGMATKFETRSVTAQELVIAQNIPDLGKKFLTQQTIGEPSKLDIGGAGYQAIPEPLIRREIDGHGNEKLGVPLRAIRGMSKIFRLQGLTGGEHNRTPAVIEYLREQGVSVVIPLAENDGLVADTPKYLPNAGEEVVKIRAVEGQRIGHIIDEYVTPTVALAVLNIARSRNAR